VIAKALSTAKTEAEKAEAKGALLAAGKLLGLLQQDAAAWFKGDTGPESNIQELINERNQAKRTRTIKKRIRYA